MADKLGTTVFDTLEEASVYQAKVDFLDAALRDMAPADRHEWFVHNNGANIDDILETVQLGDNV